MHPLPLCLVWPCWPFPCCSCFSFGSRHVSFREQAIHPNVHIMKMRKIDPAFMSPDQLSFFLTKKNTLGTEYHYTARSSKRTCINCTPYGAHSRIFVALHWHQWERSRHLSSPPRSNLTCCL
ncbi:hypothetical protein V8C42DRAFT_305131 [Trichoderma barbatum]